MLNKEKHRIYKKDPVKFIREVLGIRLRQYQTFQLAFLDEHYIHRWARQTGKNTSIYYSTIWKSIFFPGTKTVISISPNHIHLYESELKTLLDKLRTLGDITHTYTTTRIRYGLREIKIANGSAITIVSDTKINNFLDYDYFFYNLESGPSYDADIYDDLPAKPVVHIFGEVHSTNSKIPVQIVSWKDLPHRDDEWARMSIRQLGPCIFKREYLATDEDIERLS